MKSPLRNLVLSGLLIAGPAIGFFLVETPTAPATPAALKQQALSPGLGDLSPYKDIVSDTRKTAAGGDLVAAEHRITDFETLWDDNAAVLRKADRGAWNAVDGAADKAFAALRTQMPDRGQVDAALAKLQAALDGSVSAKSDQPVQYVSGLAVTDTSGRALPCEELLGRLGDALKGKAPSTSVASLQSKALERCNADDDAHADAFAAQALAQIKG